MRFTGVWNAFLRGMRPDLGCALSDLFGEDVEHVCPCGQSGNFCYGSRQLAQQFCCHLFDALDRSACSEPGRLGHSAPVAAVDVATSSLPPDGLGMVLSDVCPGKSGHEVVERGQSRGAGTQEDRVILRVRIDVTDGHVEDDGVEEAGNVARGHVLAD